MIQNKKPIKRKIQKMEGIEKYLQDNNSHYFLFVLGSLFSIVTLVLMMSGIICPILPILIYVILAYVSVEAYKGGIRG